jgi:cyd operon protein YbgT
VVQDGILGVISSVGLTMFPFILPSSSIRSSLTVWDSSSSHLTLFIMLVVTVIFMPIILAYTAWVYKVLWGKVTEADVTEQRHRLLIRRTQDMWYFAWLLGLPLAAMFAVVNAMWLELSHPRDACSWALQQVAWPQPP